MTKSIHHMTRMIMCTITLLSVAHIILIPFHSYLSLRQTLWTGGLFCLRFYQKSLLLNWVIPPSGDILERKKADKWVHKRCILSIYILAVDHLVPLLCVTWWWWYEMSILLICPHTQWFSVLLFTDCSTKPNVSCVLYLSSQPYHHQITPKTQLTIDFSWWMTVIMTYFFSLSSIL